MKTKKGIQMDISEENGKMEGWLFLIRSNRFGLQYSRKRYYVLEEHSLNCFKSTPISEKEIPIRSALIDSCIRVTDNGRENIQRKVFFIFTLYNASNHNDQLKLGAGSSEEAAKWIHSIMESALKECPNQGENILARSRSKWQSHRQMGCHTNLQMRRGEYCRICKLLSRHKGMSRMNTLDFLDWTVFSSLHTEPMSADVVAPSPWIIFGCKNGLRLFRESKDGDFHGKHWDDHPAIMAVGVVDATSESVFQTVMSLGPSRADVVDHLDGHTDIIHKQMNSNWLPWGMKRRDLLLRRYWRREDDGTYGGGYVISTLNQGKQCVVKHMLAIDWKFWKSYVITSSASCITIRMLGRIAALREMFRAKLGNYSCSDFSSGELAREMLPHSEKEDIMEDVQIPKENNQSKDSAKEAQELNVKPSNHGGSFLQLNDAADEFFDVPEQSEYSEHFDLESSQFGLHHLESPNVMDPQVLDLRHAKLSTAAVFVKKKLHDLAVQSKGCIDFSEVAKDDDISWNYGSTLPKDPNCNLACSWAMSDPSTYLIRGAHYLDDHQKIKPKGTMMQMVAADWLRSDKREDDLSGRPGSFVQKHAAHGGKEFFFTVNIQVPGATTYNLVSYYMLDSPVENIPVLERFIKGDNAYRNSRFKLIPYISKGSWLVKQSVGKKACLVGQALEINYFHGKNYLELGIDVGSSTVARGVVSLVLGYLTNLVIEMAFLIQANTEDELPEVLLGTCRFNHLDVSKSVSVKP